MHRSASILLVATIGLAIFSASGAYAQVAAKGGPAAVEPASSNVIDGVTYYYDADGNPLYKDDPVHYDYPRRFYYRNGGWVMARSGYGHNHSRYANTGVHKRRGQNVGPGQTSESGQGVSIRKGGRNDQAAQRDKTTASGQNTTGTKRSQADQGARAKKAQVGQGEPAGQKGQGASSAKTGKAQPGGSSGTTGQAGHGALSGKTGGSSASAGSGSSTRGGQSRSGAAVGSGKSGGGGGKSSGGASHSSGSAGHGGRRGPK